MSTDPLYIVSRKFPQGLFITLEGLEGSGKTTQGKRLKEWFQRQGHEVVLVGEPGGTPYGLKARELFLAEHRNLAPAAEVGLLLTAKAQLLFTVIFPALAAGKVVICDRYTDTLFAYQHYAKGHDARMMQRMLEAFGCDYNPHLTILFDIAPETSVRRSLQRKNEGGEYTDLDAETVEFHGRVRTGLHQRILKWVGRPYISIPSDTATMDQITDRTVDALRQFLHDHYERPVSVAA